MAMFLNMAISVPALAAVGLLMALLACALRRWRLALRVAAVSSLTGLLGFVAIVGVSVRASSSGAGPMILPGAALDPNLDPAYKARAMVESISLLTNSAALGVLTAGGGAAVWLLVRWRLRLVQKHPAPDHASQ
jgi:hypothetical protein